jgi:transglutaminase-like putative cysteine protease
VRLAIDHVTRYRFESPVARGLQRLRLTPASMPGQEVRDWSLAIEGGRIEAEYRDHHGNDVTLLSIEPGTRELAIRGSGVIEVADRHGIVGDHAGLLPLWFYRDPTALTRAGPTVRALLGLPLDEEPLGRLHALSAAIRDAVRYATGTTGPGTTAEEAAAAGTGVCQDHAHIFIAAARLLGFPARYVSGYLMMDDRVDQDASHGWAEAHVEALGWVGFDVSNGVSPDARYVRLATGRDYGEAAPITGLVQGAGNEEMHVALAVEQQHVEQ